MQKSSKPNKQLSFVSMLPSKLVITITGKLDAWSIVSLWHEVLNLQKKYRPEILIFDAKEISYCDSIGATLILQLKQNQLAANHKFLLQDASEDIERIFNFVEQQHGVNATHKVQKSMPFAAKVGEKTVSVLAEMRENVSFLGAVFVNLLLVIRNPKYIRWQDFWRAMDDVGPRALFIVVLIGFLVGLITTFQSSAPLERFGAQIYIIDLVGLGLLREMGPLMTAVLLAGRTASAFAAEIGAMSINEEIDALKTMGVDPTRFLTIPRILAAVIMTPFLSMFLIVSGLFGCLLVMMSLGYNFDLFASQFYHAVSLTDFLSGLVKTFVFGAVIAGIGCLHGIKTHIGASAVGESTTKAIVGSIIMLVIVDGVFATIYYVLGI